MVQASRSTVMRRAGAFLALVVFEIAAVVVLHRLGELPWLRIPLDDLEGWLQTSAPEDVLAAVVRLIALGAAWWLLGSTALYVLARLSRIPNAVRAVELITLPSVRRLADQAIALTLATSIMSGGASAALANPAGLPSGRPQAAVASHDPLATWTRVSTLGYRPAPTTQDTPTYQPEAAGNLTAESGGGAQPEEPGYHPEAAGTASGSTGPGAARATPSGGAETPGAGAGAGTAAESGGGAGAPATTAASPTTSTGQPPTTTSPSPSSTSTAPSSTAPGSTRPEPTRAPSAVEPPPAAKRPAAGYVPGVAGPAPSARSGAAGYVPGAAGPAPEARSGAAGPPGAAGLAPGTTRPPAPAPPGYRPGAAGRPPAQQAPLPGDPSAGSEPALHPVVEGDNLWTIARDHLAKVTRRRPSELTEREIARYWLEVVDANRADLPSGDPDIIRPGDKIKLPPVTTRREP